MLRNCDEGSQELLRKTEAESIRTSPRRRIPRHGIQTMELLLTLPLVVLTLVSGVYLGMAGVTKQTLQCAASAAANEAAMGGDAEGIRIAADRALAVHELRMGEGLFLVVEDRKGIRYQIGDESVFPEGFEKRRELLEGEVRAMLFVAREATGIPEHINFAGTEIDNHDLSAVATSVTH